MLILKQKGIQYANLSGNRIASLGFPRVGRQREFKYAPSCSLLHSPVDLDVETELASALKLQLSFAHDDISCKQITTQIGLAIRDEVVDLQNAGMGTI